jgi:hypothetical protein
MVPGLGKYGSAATGRTFVCIGAHAARARPWTVDLGGGWADTELMAREVA